MLKQVSVLLKTKKHIRAYLLNNFGEQPMIDSKHIFHNYLLLCYSHTLTLNMHEMLKDTVDMKLYITPSDNQRYGCWLNARQMHFFNTHVDAFMKELLISKADSYLDLHHRPVLKDALAYALDYLKVTEDDWEWDTIVRHYHRSRERRGRPLLYKKEKTLQEMSDYKNSTIIQP